MKKFCAFLLSLLLLSARAQAGTVVVSPFDPSSGEAQIAAAVAESLSAACEPAEDSPAAANRMLSDPGVILFDTQAALISGLQGYTDQDLRQAMTPLCRVARCPLFLVMDKTAAAEYGIEDAASFLTCIEANEYEFLLARHITADPVDRAATKLSDELPLLTDYFLPEEILEELHTGGVQAAILDGVTMRAADDGELLVLCALGDRRAKAYPDVPSAPEAGLPVCQDIFLGLYKANAGEEEAAPAADPELEALLLSLGYEFSPLAGDDFKREIQDTFADYKAYMTAEGLFFYEE